MINRRETSHALSALDRKDNIFARLWKTKRNFAAQSRIIAGEENSHRTVCYALGTERI